LKIEAFVQRSKKKTRKEEEKKTVSHDGSYILGVNVITFLRTSFFPLFQLNSTQPTAGSKPSQFTK
jgi:hypothetical protein